MASREIVLWLDERWYDALERQLRGESLQDKLEEWETYTHAVARVLTAGIDNRRRPRWQFITLARCTSEHLGFPLGNS